MSDPRSARVADDQLPPVRPLVVAVVPFADEGLSSLVSRSTRANVLGSTQIILREVGLALAHPGTVGQELGDRGPRLAAKIGCTPEEVAARTHAYVDGRTGGVVRFGDGTLRRSDLILDRRRLSPAALSRASYGRAAWQCRHLPYDPETLELLIDACPHCGEHLRWSRAWGIEVCEGCRQDVLAAEPPRLDPALGEAYRAFAALISIVSKDRVATRATLAPELAALPQPALLDLIVGLGLALGPGHVAAGRRTITALQPAELAAAACRGMGLIETWPDRLRSAVVDARRALEVAGSPAPLLRALRSLGDARAFTAEQAAVVRRALPEAFEDARRALGAMEAPVVLARDITRMAGISSSDVARLRDHDLLEASAPSGRLRRHAQFRLDQAAELAERRRSSVPITRLERWLGLPRYAAEQLMALGEVGWEDHPGVVLLDPVPRVTTASLESLERRLCEAVRNGPAPAGAIPIWAAARRAGGAPKAWGRILSAIASGDLAVHATGRGDGRPFARRVAVDPADLAAFPPGSCLAEPPAGLTRSTAVSQADACELLNLDALQIRPVIETGVISFEARGKALTAPLDQVLSHAAAMIPAAEIGPMLGVRHDHVPRIMRSLPAVRELPGGWSRPDVAAARDIIRSRRRARCVPPCATPADPPTHVTGEKW